jgi:isoquinoline 1-oxidoreductase beta subunit
MTYMETTRRAFVFTTAAAGGGLLLGIHSPAIAGIVNPKPWAGQGKDGAEFSQYLSIDPDGSVTFRIAACEMGQDALTSGTQILAEELPVSLAHVRAELVDANRHIVEDYAYGTASKVLIITASNHIKTMRVLYQQAGASARERLKLAAATAWGVNPSQVTAKDSVLSSGTQSGTFGEFATAAASVTLPEEPAIKTPDQFTVIGTSVSRMDNPLKVNGSAQFGIDTRIPGMVYAAIQASPVPGGSLTSYDFSAISDRPGVLHALELARNEPVYNMDRPWAGQLDPASGRGGNAISNAVVVVADTWYRAKTALELMPVQWEDGPGAGLDNEALYAERFGLIGQGTEPRSEDGTPVQIIAASSNVVRADYLRPYVSHSPMEPMNATAAFSGSRLDVWVGTQSPVIDVDAAADQSGLDVADTYIHNTFMGGGFGRRGVTGAQTTRQAVEIAKQIGLPVKLLWSREEDTMQNFQRSMGAARLTAAIDAYGLPEAVITQIAGERYYARRGLSIGYDIPNQRTETHVIDTAHIPITYLRAVGSGLYKYMTEQFADEMALAGGWDPLEWRLEMTKGKEDLQLVLNTLKSESGYTMDLPRGEGMGVAAAGSYGGGAAGYVSTVSVSRRGQLRIDKVVGVVSTGNLLSPRGATDQVESCIIYELSHVLRGGLEIRNGRVVSNNFDTYHLMQQADMPEIEVHFALTGGDHWGGMGEPPMPPIGPSVANAVYAATGKRVRSTPISNHDLSWS